MDKSIEKHDEEREWSKVMGREMKKCMQDTWSRGPKKGFFKKIIYVYNYVCINIELIINKTKAAIWNNCLQTF